MEIVYRMPRVYIYDFWAIFRFLTKISICDEKVDFWSNFRFSMKKSIFNQTFDFWLKFRFAMKKSIFGETFDFRWKNRFLVKLSIFDEKNRVLVKISISMKKSVFDQNFDFPWKNWFLVKISIFHDKKIDFWSKFRILKANFCGIRLPISNSGMCNSTLSPASTLNDSMTCSAVSLSVVSRVMNSINDLNVTWPVPVGSTIARIRWNSASP